MSKSIGPPHQERFKRQSRVERRAASAVLGNRAGRGNGFDVVSKMADLAFFQMGDHRRGSDGERLSGPDRCRANGQIDPRYRRAFGLPTSEQSLRIMGLNPALQE